jgi:ankyrin repeat protein
VNGWTPLHAALYLRKYKTAKLLLSRGANINAQDTFGVTPMMAFVLASKFKDSTMWKHLLSRGPDVTLTDKVLTVVDR